MKLSNKAARFGWWFSACFLLICAVFTYILIRDGLARAASSPHSLAASARQAPQRLPTENLSLLLNLAPPQGWVLMPPVIIM